MFFSIVTTYNVYNSHRCEFQNPVGSLNKIGGETSVVFVKMTKNMIRDKEDMF